MVYIYATIIVFLLFLVLAAEHVLNRYVHTRNSKRVLSAETGLGIILGVLLSVYFWPEGPFYAVVLTAMGLSFAIVVLLTLATVEFWRTRKQKAYDQEIRGLRKELDDCRADLEKFSFKIRELENKKSLIERRNQEELAKQSSLLDQVEGWKQGEGLARVRSVKVEDWQNELKILSLEALEEREKEVNRLLIEATELADSERHQQLVTQLNLIRLEAIKRKLDEPNRQIRELQKEIFEVSSKLEWKHKELKVIEENLQHWKELKKQFLRERVRLD